jgi:hypothetical protein
VRPARAQLDFHGGRTALGDALHAQNGIRKRADPHAREREVAGAAALLPAGRRVLQQDFF